MDSIRIGKRTLRSIVLRLRARTFENEKTQLRAHDNFLFYQYSLRFQCEVLLAHARYQKSLPMPPALSSPLSSAHYTILFSASHHLLLLLFMPSLLSSSNYDPVVHTNTKSLVTALPLATPLPAPHHTSPTHPANNTASAQTGAIRSSHQTHSSVPSYYNPSPF